MSELNNALLDAHMRRRAIEVIVGASELVGVHGLHLAVSEMDYMPERVLRALHMLGVSEQEIAVIDSEEEQWAPTSSG
jgi:hypothetical protein